MRTLVIMVVTVLLVSACGVEAPAPKQDKDATTKVEPQMKPAYSRSGHDIRSISDEQRAELAAKLTPAAYQITQKEGTERPFCGTLLDNKKDGAYACVVCGLPLFSSQHKFDSGTGWPSFFTPYDEQHISRTEDGNMGIMRTEISCARCDAHLGHVFPDGPQPTGDRHCLNSGALVFLEEGQSVPQESQPVQNETAYFAGGCFWGVEHWFQQGDGIISAESGYMQGRTDNPTYKDICYKDTGHAEAVKVVYDPSRITYDHLLEAFFKMHDPTQLNRQGFDMGDQYHSGIYTINDDQANQAKNYIDKLTSDEIFPRPIVTEVAQAETFFPAEDYHQDYINKTGRACHVQDPWTDQATTSN